MSDLGTYQLPESWRWTTIPSLVGRQGVFIDGDWVESKDQDPNGDVRLIQLADVGDGVYRDKSARFLTSKKAADLNCTVLVEGDVLIARMPDPLGRACIFPGAPQPCVTVVDVCVVRSSNGEFDHRWLSWFVNAHPFRVAVSELQAGSTRKRISRGNLGTIQLPLPPLDEQRRIVAEIEQQFTRLEAGVTALRQVQAKLKRYRAAVLKAACEGRLVPTEAELARQEARPYESASELLARILTERRKKWQGRGQYAVVSPAKSADLNEVPEGWTWATVEQVAAIGSGNTPANINEVAASEGELAWYKVGDMNHPANATVMRVAERYLSKQSAKKIGLKPFPAGTIIFPKRGGAIATNKKRMLDAEATTDLNVMGLTPSADLLPYFWSWFSSIDLASFSDGSNVPQVNNKDICPIPIPLPPLAEQTRIVAEVERRLSVVDALETVVNANLKRAARLRQSILQRAFVGKLVKLN